MKNPFKQPPLIRIEMGQDTAGVPIMRIQLDQMWAKHHTGQFVANPVCFVPTALQDLGYTMDMELDAAGWFHPTEEYCQAVTNYQLETMYDKQSRPTNITGHLDTMDVGRLSVCVCALEKKTSFPVKPSRLPSHLPGAAESYVTDIQEATTQLAKQENQSLDRLWNMVETVTNERRAQILTYPGGESEVIKECDLRMLMSNKRLYKNHETVEAVREKGKQIATELESCYEAELLGLAEAKKQELPTETLSDHWP